MTPSSRASLSASPMDEDLFNPFYHIVSADVNDKSSSSSNAQRVKAVHTRKTPEHRVRKVRTLTPNEDGTVSLIEMVLTFHYMALFDSSFKFRLWFLLNMARFYCMMLGQLTMKIPHITQIAISILSDIMLSDHSSVWSMPTSRTLTMSVKLLAENKVLRYARLIF
jgi:hypothetical protein